MQELISQVKSELRQMEREWAVTQESWKDRTTRYFDSNYMLPLFDETKRFIAALDELQEAVREAERVLRS